MRLAEKLQVSEKAQADIEMLLPYIDINKTFTGTAKLPWGVAKEGRGDIKFLKSDLIKRNTKEVENFYKGLNFIARPTFRLTEKNVLELHKIIVQDTPGSTHPGRYKPIDNAVFYAPKATKEEAPGMFRNLITWTNKELEKGKIHPVLIAGLFFYEMLTIHPMSDGNGRTARALYHHILLKSGYEFVRYSSFETLMLANKEKYYESLIIDQRMVAEKKDIVCCFQIYLLFILGKMINSIKQS